MAAKFLAEEATKLMNHFVTIFVCFGPILMDDFKKRSDRKKSKKTQ